MEDILAQLWKGFMPQNQGTRRSWEGALWKNLRVPCEADFKIFLCVWNGAGQAEEGGGALSFPPLYQAVGSKVGTETQQNPSPSWNESWGQGSRQPWGLFTLLAQVTTDLDPSMSALCAQPLPDTS